MNEKVTPRATYRLQFNRNFTFVEATRRVPYLAALGISHVYASPCLKARAGSLHGYDIVDHNAFNPEIGSREEFEHFVDTLHDHGMGLILDIVPNHLGIAGGENTWWLDVLEHGQSSAYAAYFDIDWHPVKEALRSKVLLPVLGAQYGEVLERGELTLAFDSRRGEFAIRYYDHRFPLDPETYPVILAHEMDSLAARAAEESHAMTEWHGLVADFERLRAARGVPTERLRASAACKQCLAALFERSPSVRAFIEEKIAVYNGAAGHQGSFDLLHGLLEQQSFRLAYWRVAADEINYRRFFDVNELVCLRQENSEVFDATHRLLFALIADGSVDGLRVDHPDGLHDPRAYFRRLQDEACRGRDCLPGTATPREDKPLYLVAEKILAGYEHLPEDWAIDGDTGYAYANLVNGLFIYPGSERELTRLYARFTGIRSTFDEVWYDRKREIIRSQLSSELTVLANLLDGIAQAGRDTRDYTLNGLREALTEVVACFPVYRTYVTPESVSEDDRRFVDWAVAQAKRRSPAADTSVFDFIRDILLLSKLENREADYRGRVLRFAMRFQQYTAPVNAKGMEDTAFYVYNRLVALNEVGGDPRRFGVSPAAFHTTNQQRLRHWPRAMLNTSTHDSKRGEDVRARLDVISELVDEWPQMLTRWSRLNRRKKRPVDDAPAPSRNDEYLLYQTLLGTWPVEPLDASGLEQFRARIEAYMLKALREAKIHTSWINPNEAYEAAVTAFVRGLLDASAGKAFLADFLPFQQRVARFGLYNSLSATLLKLTSPGVPDIYQGTELWSFTLVDPDNRGPVDFNLRERTLRSLRDTDVAPDHLRSLIERLEEGRAKLHLIRKTLALRRDYPDVFAWGDYLPLESVGEKAEHLCSFARRREQITILVIAARWFARLLLGRDGLPLGTAVWGDTFIPLPDGAGGTVFKEVLSDRHVTTMAQDGRRLLRIGEVLSHFPVALLISADR
ncbi:malto-oligosyltrehalose synthase [Methylococcus sp. EFPC2]|uniref:malto-oligosyltrehalose synthase n=1 Tax=Methylococcus sp. EFPC2 TaxID=2812648 RepID=UPI00196756F6|nr:malto-oligosyltrehalose synthase [Methylococcus sp. EFPC2]QSA98178.1 malto-oligosyltrehalose synthase [Methylococcus sp. EFPC2]